MALTLNHVHIKSPDPQAAAQFYINTLGATKVADIGENGVRLDLHGLFLNVTGIIPTQTRDQKYGVEHIAINTDDIGGTIEALEANGATVLEESATADHRRVVFLEGRDGVQVELLEQR